MIDNNDKIGNYFVTIVADSNVVNSFQCPTMADVREEVARIHAERIAAGLPFKQAYCQVLTGKSKKGFRFTPRLGVFLPKA